MSELYRTVATLVFVGGGIALYFGASLDELYPFLLASLFFMLGAIYEAVKG